MKRSLLFVLYGCSSLFLNACGGGATQVSTLSVGATHFALTAPGTATIGSVFSFTVTALDAANNLATGYSGPVRFTSTDSQAALPGNTALAGGMGMFSATLETVGSQTIYATDMVKTTITGATNSIRVATGATSFSVTAPSFATTGKAFNFTVTALDLSGNPVTNYAGTVTFTSTDGQAVLPSNSPLTSGTGRATFSVTLQTAGIQTITASDTATPLLTGTSSRIQVSPPAVGFTPTGSMRGGRAGHTGTLLNDGNVLVAGGFDWACPPVGPCNGFVMLIVGFAETYDTPAGIFKSPTLMNVPRVFHTATLLQDGKVLVAGGDNRYTTTYDSAEIYDPSTNSFTPTANMLSAPSGHTATLLAKGKYAQNSLILQTGLSRLPGIWRFSAQSTRRGLDYGREQSRRIRPGENSLNRGTLPLERDCDPRKGLRTTTLD